MSRGREWRDGVGLLNRYLAASSLSLPKCREVASKRSAVEVLGAMAAADAEITGVLGQLAEEGAADRQRRGGVRKVQLKVRRDGRLAGLELVDERRKFIAGAVQDAEEILHEANRGARVSAYEDDEQHYQRPADGPTHGWDPL